MNDKVEKLEAHLDELTKKHRALDEKIIQIQTHHITEELRRLKTQKLWLKDEIYRIEKQLVSAGVYVNGYH